MAQLTRLSLVVTLCFLGTACVRQVTPSGKRDPASTKVVVLKCNSDKVQTFTVQRTVDTVIFVTSEDCPLTSDSLSFDQDITNLFTLQGKDSDGKNYVYSYSKNALPTNPPLGFKYRTGGTGPESGNGTGVIKN